MFRASKELFIDANIDFRNKLIKNLSNPIDPQDAVTKSYLEQMVFEVTDALIYKGTIGISGTLTQLPTTYKIGWSYKIVTNGIYAGQTCEVGDLVIAIIDRSGLNNEDSDWTVIQNNLDKAVSGPDTSINNAIVLFDGMTGKQIKNSFATIDASGSISASNLELSQDLIISGSTSMSGSLKIDSTITPIQLTSGNLTENIQIGNIEFDGTDLWITYNE